MPEEQAADLRVCCAQETDLMERRRNEGMDESADHNRFI